MGRNWRRVQPRDLRDALRLNKDHALDKRRLSVERIADLMGVSADLLYKWLSTGRMPASLIPVYEHVCGVNFVTRWLAASGGSLVIPHAKGTRPDSDDLLETQALFASAMRLLSDFYQGRADQSETLAALDQILTNISWHHQNVHTFKTPELDL